MLRVRFWALIQISQSEKWLGFDSWERFADWGQSAAGFGPFPYSSKSTPHKSAKHPRHGWAEISWQRVSRIKANFVSMLSGMCQFSQWLVVNDDCNITAKGGSNAMDGTLAPPLGRVRGGTLDVDSSGGIRVTLEATSRVRAPRVAGRDELPATSVNKITLVTTLRHKNTARKSGELWYREINCLAVLQSASALT